MKEVEMSGVSVYLDGQLKEVTEQDARGMLLEKARYIARNARARWSLSEIQRMLNGVTNCLYMGRQQVLKNYDNIEIPFPEAWALKQKLLKLLGDYCMKQYGMSLRDWNAGWEKEIIPKN